MLDGAQDGLERLHRKLPKLLELVPEVLGAASRRRDSRLRRHRLRDGARRHLRTRRQGQEPGQARGSQAQEETGDRVHRKARVRFRALRFTLDEPGRKPERDQLPVPGSDPDPRHRLHRLRERLPGPLVRARPDVPPRDVGVGRNVGETFGNSTDGRRVVRRRRRNVGDRSRVPAGLVRSGLVFEFEVSGTTTFSFLKLN